MLPLAVGLVTLISTIALFSLYCLITKLTKIKLSSANVVLVCSSKAMSQRNLTKKMSLQIKKRRVLQGLVLWKFLYCFYTINLFWVQNINPTHFAFYHFMLNLAKTKTSWKFSLAVSYVVFGRVVVFHLSPLIIPVFCLYCLPPKTSMGVDMDMGVQWFPYLQDGFPCCLALDN